MNKTKNDEMIRPFTIGKEDEIRPFIIGKGDEMKPFTVSKENEMKKPFIIEKDEKITEKLCANIVQYDEAVCELEGQSLIEKKCKQNKEQEENAEKLKRIEQGKNSTNANTATSEQKAQTNEKREVITDVFNQVSNYTLTPYEKIIFLDRNGKEISEREIIRLKIEIERETPKEFEVRTVDIHRIAKLIGKRFSTARVDETESKAEKIVESEFRRKTYGIRIIRCLTQAGWQVVDGRHLYVHDALCMGVNTTIQTGVSLPKYTSVSLQQLKEYCHRALNIYGDKSVAATMFLYAFTGVTYKLFDEAGYPPHFLLFLNGKTGAMKTTIGKILFNQLKCEKHRDHVRRIDADTIVSFERALVEQGIDTITLIDDYAPAKTEKKKAELADKLESIIRMVGDGSTKSRSNTSLQDVQGEGVHGTVVLTGEIRGKGLSSNLRCLYCEIVRDKVNVENVSFFQENPYAFTTVVSSFADFLSNNWEKCFTHIKQEFPKKRIEIARKIEERRLVDSVVVLQIIAEIFQNFLMQYNICTVPEAENLVGTLKNLVIENAVYSQSISDEETPGLMYLKAVNVLMTQNKIVVCDKAVFVNNGKIHGFEDEKFFFFVPEMVFAEVQNYFRSLRTYFPLDLRETTICLYEDGYIKTCSNGVGKRTYYARISTDNSGKKQKFLKISKEIMQQIAEADE